MRKELAKLSENEIKEAVTLCRKRKWLQNMDALTKNDDVLNQRVKNDSQVLESQFSQWWSKIAEKYDLETISDGRWLLDFETGHIILTNE